MLPFLISGALYTLGFVLILRRLELREQSQQSIVPLIVAACGALGHVIALSNNALGSNSVNLALGHVASLVCLVTVAAWAAASIRRRMTNLGILVLPTGLLGLCIGQFLSGPDLILRQPPLSLALHLGIALLAFAILCVATAQAALLYLQEDQLRNHNPRGLFPALPPLETMQTNLLLLIQLGVLLLTINLITGTISNHQINGTLLSFNHHVLLSIVAWTAYAALLAGHKVYGWRGKIAARWTMLAFGLLILAYFGSRFVSSVILS